MEVLKIGKIKEDLLDLTQLKEKIKEDDED